MGTTISETCEDCGSTIVVTNHQLGYPDSMVRDIEAWRGMHQHPPLEDVDDDPEVDPLVDPLADLGGPGERCVVTSPDFRHSCSRERGHPGVHACAVDGVVDYTWPQTP